jgi:GntR family transcriptional regulator
MFLKIDGEDKRPLYRQIVDGVKTLIARGELREGMALPPVRHVAKNLGVNLNTIAGAYRQLQEEGLVTVRHGSGAVVSSRCVREEDKEEARKRLRTALTEMVLSGLKPREIAATVREELRLLGQGEASC